MLNLRCGPCLALLTFCLVLLVPVAAHAQATVTLAWDPSANAAGYVVRWGTAKDKYNKSTDAAGNTTAQVTGLVPGTTYWAVVEAYDALGIFSEPSVPLQFTVPSAPGACAYTLNSTSISISADAGIGTLTMTAPSGCRWNATSASSFIAFTDGSGRAGSGTIQIHITANNSTQARVGTATIGGVEFTVMQAGLSPEALAARARENARADFDGDNFNDLLWQADDFGYLAAWTLNGSHATKNAVPLSHTAPGPDWRIVGTGDFNADGKPDIVWHHRTEGRLLLWHMNGVTRLSAASFSIEGISDPAWRVMGVGDFNGDSKPDLVWQHDRLGWLAVWLMDGTTLIGGLDMSPVRVDVEWKIAGVADLNGDRKSDLLWRNQKNGLIGAWLMDGVTRLDYRELTPGRIPEQEWQIAAVLDVNGDGQSDIVWRHSVGGWIAVWYMNGTTRVGAASFPVAVETLWRIAGPK